MRKPILPMQIDLTHIFSSLDHDVLHDLEMHRENMIRTRWNSWFAGPRGIGILVAFIIVLFLVIYFEGNLIVAIVPAILVVIWIFVDGNIQYQEQRNYVHGYREQIVARLLKETCDGITTDQNYALTLDEFLHSGLFPNFNRKSTLPKKLKSENLIVGTVDGDQVSVSQVHAYRESGQGHINTIFQGLYYTIDTAYRSDLWHDDLARLSQNDKQLEIAILDGRIYVAVYTDQPFLEPDPQFAVNDTAQLERMNSDVQQLLSLFITLGVVKPSFS